MPSPSKKSTSQVEEVDKLERLQKSIDRLSLRVSSIEDNERNFDIENKLDRIAQAVHELQSTPKVDFSLPPPLQRSAHREDRSVYREDRRLRPEGHLEGGATGYNPRGSNTLTVSAVEVQDEFKVIRDKYANIEIPAQFKVTTDRTGVKRDDQCKINLIANCAKFSESLMRLSLSSDNDSESIKQQVFIIAAAQQKLLQTEYSAVVVDNSFDSQTAKFYKQLRKHTSAFDPESLTDLKDAVAVCSRYKPPSDSNYRGRYNFRYQRGNRGNRGRGRQDIYAQATGSQQIPTSRPQNDGQ